MNKELPGLKVSVSSQPRYAPADYASLPAWTGQIDDMDETKGWGSGNPTNLLCEACGHGGKDLEDAVKNKRIFFYDMTQRNGNYSSRSEIVCTKCKQFSTIETWEEG